MGDCWIWNGSKSKKGYGRINVKVGGSWKVMLTHRVAYIEMVTEVPAGLELDHTCRNSACWRPDHLDPVTHAVNLQRAAPYFLLDMCRRGIHRLTPENLVTRVRGGRIRRSCRKCANRRQREYQHRAKG